MRKILRNKNLITIIISCIIIVVLFVSSSFFRVLNKTIQNKYYSIKNEIIGIEASPHILIVELDDESLKYFGSFPFPRGVYSQILDNIREYSAAVVAFDILFLDPSLPKEDNLFVQAIKNYPNVILGASIDSSRNIQIPFSQIDKNTYMTGFLPPVVDASNKTVYSFKPSFIDKEGKKYEHFTLQILRSFYSYLYEDSNILQIGKNNGQEYLFSDSITYPFASKKSEDILINFIPESLFQRVSLKDLYEKESIKQVDRRFGLRDKIILIGPAADGLKDEFFTPNGVEYGVNIHANILNTLLSRQYMTYFNVQLEWLMIFLIIILSVKANLSSSNKTLLFSNTAIVLIFWFIIPLSILLGTSLILNYPSEIIFSLLLAFTSANVVKYLIENKNKQKLNQALSEYVGSSVAEEILLEHGKVNLDGEEKNLVCFFSDIEGFTSLSERLSPEELVLFLREYLSAMTTVIMDYDGHVDKFEGDAIMALWGAFTEHEIGDFTKACESALLQQKSLTLLSQKWNTRLGSTFRVRMGIHGGKAIVGNIGAVGRKMEFTALGDNINLASRLEGVNKFYGTTICVSEVVYQATKETFVFRYLDIIQVKGKDQAVKIYELIGEKNTIDSQHTQIYIRFSKGIEYYKKRDFVKALEIFESLSIKGDSPSQTYSERCEQYIKTSPPENWDGVWRMMEK